jgi:hypothetical protein
MSMNTRNFNPDMTPRMVRADDGTDEDDDDEERSAADNPTNGFDPSVVQAAPDATIANLKPVSGPAPAESNPRTWPGYKKIS